MTDFIALDVVSHSLVNGYSPKCLEGVFSEVHIAPALLRQVIAGHLQRTRSGLCNVMAARSGQIGAPPNPISFPSGS